MSTSNRPISEICKTTPTTQSLYNALEMFLPVLENARSAKLLLVHVKTFFFFLVFVLFCFLFLFLQTANIGSAMLPSPEILNDCDFKFGLGGTAPQASFWTVFAFFSKTTTHW